MSATSTHKGHEAAAVKDDMPSLADHPGRFVRRAKRGAHANHRVSIRTVRTSLRLTQAEVASRLGVHQSEVSRLEQRPEMSISTLARYAAALGAGLELAFTFPDGRRIPVTTAPPFIVGDDGERRPLPDDD
jgi:DNA-binding transcriptional regulator YiaG